MMSIHERLQTNRVPLDKWSIREQLCLASAVACSEDQNWMSVSRTVKIVCGNTRTYFQPRPADWFSKKNCAIQYGHLLQDVEIPKPHKRSSESNLSCSLGTVERPTDSVLRKLTKERMQEINIELRNEQEEYAKLFKEIKSIQNGEVDDDQLLQMWTELEKEQEMKRIEEMKLENQLRERELKNQELQRSWRTSGNTHNSSPANSLKLSTDTTTVDMDVEEIIGSGNTMIPGSNNAVQMQTGVSSLLSSLLKSPTAGTPSTTIVVSSPSVRTTAPTITTLLTSGSIPNQNQPALIPSHDEAVHLLTRPISGPPLDSVSTPSSAALTLLSPSQSAPTLSMLLEKNKACPKNSVEAKSTDVISSNTKMFENSIANDSNNEPVPMDIEEDLAVPKIESNNNIQSSEIDETDPNEEQQLMEVFKNIGNIEELGIDVSDVIDEEVDFLKGVDEETPLDENIDIEPKLDVNLTVLAEDIKILTDENSTSNLNSVEVDKALLRQKTVDVENVDSGSNNIEIISSDDSNDNIPLSAVASLETSKDRFNMNESSNDEPFLKDEVESANLKNELDQVDTANESSNNVAAKQEILVETREHLKVNNDPIKQLDISEQQDDVFVTPTVEDVKQENILKIEKQELKEENKPQKMAEEENETNESICFVETESGEQQTANTVILDVPSDTTEILSLPKIQPPPSISIADTDENSSSTDISVQTHKNEKHINRAARKSPHELKTDDEIPNPMIQQMPIPNVISGSMTPRPTAFRKLRDRDRSESPMIDDDTTTHSDHSATNQRSRRRYSSTPIMDSIPNSPASSDRDERDLRISKKSLLSIYNVLYSSKYSATLQRVVSDELSGQKLDEICLRSIDFFTIKKNIESGLIRSVYELQRDILWMCQNALMITKMSSASFKTILQFQQECQNIREFMPNNCETGHKIEREVRDSKSNSSAFSSTGATSKGRSGSRKSLRLS